MNRNFPTVVLSDLDSTIRSTEHRHSIADEALKSDNWDAYSLECINDTPIVGSIATIRLLYPHHLIHLVSGSSEVAREFTENWLDFYEVPYDSLRMYNKSKWDRKPSNGELKVEYIRELRSKGYQVVLFLEDWPETVESIELEGVPVLCVNPRYQSTQLTYL